MGERCCYEMLIKSMYKEKPLLKEWINFQPLETKKMDQFSTDVDILTSSNVGDSSVTEDLLDQSPSSIKVVKADGGYDRSGAREAIKKNKAKALIPPPKNARIDTDNVSDKSTHMDN